MAAFIIADLSLLVQNNANNVVEFVSQMVINKEEMTSEIMFSTDNASGDKSIRLPSVDTGSFQLGSAGMINSASIGQNLSRLVFYGLLGLRPGNKES